jgi:hypothetical protein
MGERAVIQRREESAKNGPLKGGFNLNGSWNDDGSRDAPLTNFVREMRRQRQNGGITPNQVAQQIPYDFAGAFPNLGQWMPLAGWDHAVVSTSAESSVAYAFKSQGGEPRREPEPEEAVTAMGNRGHLPELETTAEEINRLCNKAGIAHGYDPRRLMLHRLHGEMAIRGASAEDVLATARNAIGEAEPTTLPEMEG